MTDFSWEPNILRMRGRTARLVNEARQLFEQGQTVIVVAATSVHAVQLRASLEEQGLTLGSLLRVITHDNVNFRYYPAPFVRGYRAELTTVLVDHFAAEVEIAELTAKLRLMQQLAMRYDT